MVARTTSAYTRTRSSTGALIAWWVVAAATLAASGCAGPGSERKTAPVGVSQPLAGVRVRIRRDPSPLDQEVGVALETELAHAGVSILVDDRGPSDADLKLALDLRSVGPVVEGVATVSVEHDGILIDRVSTALDVYRRDRFAALVARQLAQALASSPRIARLAGARGSANLPPPVAVVAAPLPAQPPPPAPAPAAPPPPIPAPSTAAEPLPAQGAPGTLGRSGRFGLGLSLELELGWSQVFAPGGSPAGVLLALGVQIDMGPHAAFRLPLSIVAADSGENAFVQLAFVPTYIYRFRNQTEQTVVPYVGVGVNLAFVEAGRSLLGRPLTGMRSPDSCSTRRSTSTVEDCAFAISPEPTAGIEWHASRLFALDIAASYSFAHLTASDGIVSWVHLLSIFVGPRVTF